MTAIDNLSHPASGRPSQLALALSVALFAMSVGAMAVQRLALCGACALSHGPWAIVAPLGAASYGVLFFVGLLGRKGLFSVGTALAAGTHTALVGAMLARGQLCLLCVIAAALAGGLFLVTLLRAASRTRMIACAYLPAVLLVSGPTAWALAQERAVESDRDAFVRAIQRHDLQDRLTIQVFEQDHCGYCRDLRDFYLPRLEREFSNRIEVRFLQATDTVWVRRTPTIVVEGGTIYEGLPESYIVLRSAVNAALAARERNLR